MGCVIVPLGFACLGLAFLYLPFLTPVNLVVMLILCGAAFLMGLSGFRSAARQRLTGLTRAGAVILMTVSCLLVALTLLLTTPREAARKFRAALRPEGAGSRATVEPVHPESGLYRVDDEILLTIRNGVYSNRYTTLLSLQPVDSGERPAGQAIQCELQAVEDNGNVLRFRPSRPMDFGVMYRAGFQGAAKSGSEEHGVSLEWKLATKPSSEVDGVNPDGFRLVRMRDNSCFVGLDGDAIGFSSPARSVALYSNSGTTNVERARAEFNPGWPARIPIASDPRSLLQGSLWIAAFDDAGQTVFRFPISGLVEADQRGAVVASTGEYTTAERVTIHYRRPGWQRSDGSRGDLAAPLTTIRVEKRVRGDCGGPIPLGLRDAGCYEISVEPLPGEMKTLLGRYPVGALRISLPGAQREQLALIPRFSISVPAPDGSPIGAAAFAVTVDGRGPYAPGLRLSGVGRVEESEGRPVIRIFGGGDTETPVARPSEIRLGEMFEGDSLVGLQGILVAESRSSITIAAGTGWNRVHLTHVGERNPRATITRGVVFSPSLPIGFLPPVFGKVRKTDGFVLPMLVGETSLLVERDAHTAWILNWNEVTIPHTSEWLTDVGSLDELLEPDRWTRDSWQQELNRWRRPDR